MFPSRNKDENKLVKTLVDTFYYPRKGPGMLWTKCAEEATKNGALVNMGTQVTGLSFNRLAKKWDVSIRGNEDRCGFDYVISTLPISELIPNIKPHLNSDVIESAKSLKYRDFILVALIMKDSGLFSDNWIYIHDPKVRVGRIQNFKSWSADMVPDQSLVCLGMEYFVNKGDELWKKTDQELASLAFEELLQLKLASKSDLLDWHIIRQCKAYPVYDDNYSTKVQKIREALKDYDNIFLIGRNGMHKYNNQDHSMMTAMLAAKNILTGENLYDVWKVNQDAEYIEEGDHPFNETKH
jgi:protoporphyrinogen oxidase